MSLNLDRSLDEILAARPRPSRRGGKASAPPAAPAGGVRKRSTRVAAQKANASVAPNAGRSANGRAPPTGPSNKVTASKIIVSNLPLDVLEQDIKEYFGKVVGPVKRALITYGPNGQSRGVATLEFYKPADAVTAAQKFNGIEVDKRPMKVELVVDPNAPPSFADRVGAPNKIINTRQPRAAQPKPVVKPTVVRGGRGATAPKRGGRGGRAAGTSGRGKPTAEQLDQEMVDYFGGNTTNAAAPAVAAPAATAGDVGMDDTVLVGTP